MGSLTFKVEPYLSYFSPICPIKLGINTNTTDILTLFVAENVINLYHPLSTTATRQNILFIMCRKNSTLLLLYQSEFCNKNGKTLFVF